MVKVPVEPDFIQHHSSRSLDQDFQQEFQLPLSLSHPELERWVDEVDACSCMGAYIHDEVAADS